MSLISIDTTQNVSIQYELASPGDRATAYIIDLIIKFAYLIVVLVLLREAPTAVIVLSILPFIFYDILLEYFMDGQTIGKKAINIKVIALSGRQADISSYLLRWLLRPVDFLIFTPAIALMVVILWGKGQRIGDMVAGTCVVNITRPRRLKYALPAFEENYVPTFTEVAKLSDKDIHLIEQILQAYKKNKNKNVAIALTAQKVKSLIGVETTLSDEEFLKTLVKDYYHLTSGEMFVS